MNSDSLKRFGPLERAIRSKDRKLFLDTVESRCTKDVATGCWLWKGARRAEGYPYIGRSRSQQLAHRAVWIAKMDFVYEKSEVPTIHHMCGVRICVNPEHLSPATAVENGAEMFARKAYVERISVLTEALRAVDPQNQLLRQVWSGDVDGPSNLQLVRGRSYESDRLRARRVIGKSGYEIRLQQNHNRRFQQVLDVKKAYSAGVPMDEALRQAGIGRSAYYDWRAQLKNRLEAHERRND